MQDFIHVRVESPAFEPGSVQVAELSGKEAISRLFQLELRLVTLEAGVDEEALLTSPVALVFERRDSAGGGVKEMRRISGMIDVLVDRALTEAHHREYVATFVPRAWQASLWKTSDVCLDMTVPQILKQKLAEGAALDGGTDVELRLAAKYPVRELVVQYKETNLDFVCRLAEDLGIFFFFEEVDGRDVLVFGDANAALKPSLPEKSQYVPRGDRVHVHELEARRQLVSKDFVARDYNYRNPSMEVHGEAKVSVLASGKVDEFGPHAKTPEEATFYARVRAEEAATRSLTFEGRSDLPGLRAGSILGIEGHPRGDLELVVVEVVHEMTQPVFGQPVARQRPYENRFQAIPKATAYRPPRLTPKPVVNSVVTGMVESESATNFGAIDEQGRYRVQFLFDSVTGRGDGKASRPLRMAQPSAAADRGFHIPLKPGTEVIISCVNGDPDRPIIAGAVPNPQTPSPVTNAISNKSIWNTNTSSIAIDDRDARCKVSVDADAHVIQMGQPEAPEEGILIGTVKNASEVADGDKTESNKTKSVYTDELTVLAAKHILEAAGIPNPMSLWDKVEEAAGKVQEYVKKAGEVAEDLLKKYDDHFGHAKKDKEEAEAKLKDSIKEAKARPAKRAKEAHQKLDETKQRLKDKLDVKGKAKPKAITDPNTGATRQETAAEAEQRTFAEELGKDPGAQQELASATKDAQAADQAKAKVEHDRHPKPVVDPTTGNTRAETAEEADQRSFNEQMKHDPESKKDVAGASEEAVDAQEAYEDFLKPVEEGKKEANEIAEKGKKAIEKVGKYAEQAIKIGEKLEKLKKVEEVIKKFPKAKKLISAISKVFSKAAEEAFDATVAGSQKLSHAVPKASKERRAADVGSFGSPYNIQLSRHSAALYGAKNAFIFGGQNATMFSALSTSILGTQQVSVKSRSLVEVAAKEVVLTGHQAVDVHASEKMKLVAHKADKAIEVPGGFNMYFHAKEGLLMDTVEKDIEARAKKNFKVTTLEENVELVAKQTVKVVAQDKDVTVTAEKGKIEIMANDGQTAVRAKKKVVVQSMDDNFTVVADKGDGTVKASKELKLESKTGKWSANEVELKVKKFIVNGNKIELG